MDSVRILLENGLQEDVLSVFYIFNSKYYFIYTTKELDENGYVILYVCQVGKETINSVNGVVETGNMLGVEITDDNEWVNVQSSITEVISDKKNNQTSSKIQYLPLSMLVNLKVLGKKIFRLKPALVEEAFGIVLKEDSLVEDVVNSTVSEPQLPQTETLPLTEVTMESEDNNSSNENDIVIDYRTSFFEEQEKNKVLQSEIEMYKEKLNSIKKIIE